MFKLNPLVAAASIALLSPMATFAADTGDAPTEYGLATHEIVANSPHLGIVAPDDNAPVNSADAEGDDTDATPDDEDSVSQFPQLVQNTKSYSVNVFATNPSAQSATLVGWVDFDGSKTFEADEAMSAQVTAGAQNQKVKLVWPDNFELSTDYFGDTYARFRISTDPLTSADATGNANDGEVEDFYVEILEDSDGDEIPNTLDADNDNDGIPDVTEGTAIDTDNDGIANYLDIDSDGDSLPDYAEAGPNPNVPQDTDGDGQPDYLDTDSNNDGVDDADGDANDSDGDGISDALEGNQDSDGDGIINSEDIDSDNDVIPDAVELGLTAPTPVDTDGDLIPDFLDLDSDNDGIPDIYESNRNEINIEEALDSNTDGRADSTLIFGTNGFVDDIEIEFPQGSGVFVPIYAIPDSDADGIRDFRDLDSDEDGTSDILEAGGTDIDSNGIVDDTVDADEDGIVDSVIINKANELFSDGFLPDVDGDGIPDFRDDDSIGVAGATNTSGGTTDGGTASTTAGNTVPGMVETGLSGSACSITDRIGNDPMFPGLLLLSSVIMFTRRKLFGCKAKR